MLLQYNPSKLSEVDAILEKFAGRERSAIVAALASKYNVRVSDVVKMAGCELGTAYVHVELAEMSEAIDLTSTPVYQGW